MALSQNQIKLGQGCSFPGMYKPGSNPQYKKKLVEEAGACKEHSWGKTLCGEDLQNIVKPT